MGAQIAGFVVTFLVVFVVAWFLGGHMFTVFRGRRTILSPVLRPIERGCYRVMGIDEEREQSWIGYLVAMLLVTVISVLFTYVLLRIQDRLPLQAQLNPNHLPAVPADLSLNTAISFSTNTNWQNYAGEQSMTHLSQMLALAFHQFLSAATGIALAIALVRGLVRRSGRTIGNFYVDITRAMLYVLLPISVVATLVLVSQGAIQNLNAATTAHTLEGGIQTIAQGPVASMEAIKDLGTNGGGFFNANSAHPYENPTGLTNAFQILLVLCLPFGLAFTFGHYARNVRQGIAIFAAMAIVLVSGAGFAAYQEQAGNPALARAGATWTSTAQQSGGNMEGKSVRFGAIQSAQYGAATTGTSTGSVDSAHDSWTPLGGLVPMVLIQLGEITPGGVGSGLYGMLVFAILAVFIGRGVRARAAGDDEPAGARRHPGKPARRAGGDHRPLRWHPAGGRRGPQGARHHPPQGHRQAGHQRALRGDAPDGAAHGDDHRRQPPDRGGDRRRGGRRRLPRRGHPRGQARTSSTSTATPPSSSRSWRRASSC